MLSPHMWITLVVAAPALADGQQAPDATSIATLYTSPVERKSGEFGGSALFAYKLDWQTVLFVGYGDERALTEQGEWARSGRELFVKLSYAFQR